MRLDQLLTDYGMILSIAAGVLGLIAAAWMIFRVLALSSGNERMVEIASAIQEGASAYLNRQVLTIAVISLPIIGLLWWQKNAPTAIGFIIGAACSLGAGYLGMSIAVRANVRTTQAAVDSERRALRAGFNGGAVTGLLVVSGALVSVALFYIIVNKLSDGDVRKTLDSLVGLALGSSLISVFARLGGGIYTKAADVGADLVGKLEYGFEEDDPRNPATIADNVGDNVGDCAGMAADVFETYAVSLIGAVLIGHLKISHENNAADAALVYPFLMGAISILGAVLGILFVNKVQLKTATALQGSVLVSGLVSALLFYPAAALIFPAKFSDSDGVLYSPLDIYFASLVGIVMTFVTVWITNYYTSTEYKPVRRIAKASETGHATNIIMGLSVGQSATALPVGLIGIAILASYHFGGLYGIATSVMAMLSMAGIIISLDAFGPITDNAGGIAVMSKLDAKVREVTDSLDAVGNTMKAVTKGYAIASAGLAALVLFGSYVEELRIRAVQKTEITSTDLRANVTEGQLIQQFEEKFQFSLKEPQVIIGLFIGGMLPFVFTARSMLAVSSAAGAVVREVRRQLEAKPKIIEGTEKPDYGQCVDIVTRAALWQMILPALLPIVFVLAPAFMTSFGPVVLGGVLVGSIVTGLFVGIAMTTSGGAWDNAKKYIETGQHGGKGSEAHKAAVTGDTVGDPYKDTAGPAVNPMIKVVNIVAILIIPIAFRNLPDELAQKAAAAKAASKQVQASTADRTESGPPAPSRTLSVRNDDVKN